MTDLAPAVESSSFSVREAFSAEMPSRTHVYLQALDTALFNWAGEQSSGSTGSKFDEELSETVTALSACLTRFGRDRKNPPGTWPDIVAKGHVNGLGQAAALHLWTAFLAKGREEMVYPLLASYQTGTPKIPMGHSEFVAVTDFLESLTVEVERQTDFNEQGANLRFITD